MWFLSELDNFLMRLYHGDDLLAAAAYTETVKERQLLWRKINELAQQTKRGKVSALWFLPVDMISFSQALVTNSLETASPTQTPLIQVSHLDTLTAELARLLGVSLTEKEVLAIQAH